MAGVRVKQPYRPYHDMVRLGRGVVRDVVCESCGCVMSVYIGPQGRRVCRDCGNGCVRSARPDLTTWFGNPWYKGFGFPGE